MLNFPLKKENIIGAVSVGLFLGEEKGRSMKIPGNFRKERLRENIVKRNPPFFYFTITTNHHFFFETMKICYFM